MSLIPAWKNSLPHTFLRLLLGMTARAGLAALVFASLVLVPAAAHAALTVNSATLDGVTSVTVIPGATITAVVNVTTSGSGAAARWYSTGWSIGTAAPGAVTCMNHANHGAAGAYSETFSVAAPATPGTYNAYFIAYSNDACSSGASATYTMAGAVVVTANPAPATTSISPASKGLGDAAFTMTVNGSNFVPGSVVNFAGSPRTTTYVSPTQLTATIPATDLAVLGMFNVTVFNPAPGGGTSNAQTFTVAAALPSATTGAATPVTAWEESVSGTVSSNGASTDVIFEYGLTTTYGYSVTATPSPLAADAANIPVSASLAGLQCNTTFHYRVVATNSSGTSNGLDGMFTTGACTGPFPANACAATRYGDNLICSAADVKLTNIAITPGGISSCVSGTSVTLDLDLTVNFSSPDRWDVGFFISNDGKLPTLLPSSGGASSCSVDILPATAPFLDLDGVPQGTLDTCGDGNSSIDDSALPGGTVPLGDGVKRMSGVTLPCYASPASGGKLFVPFAVTWDNQKSPIGSLCTSNLDPVPNSKSRCSAPASSVAINIVVLPVVTKTNGGTTINPGANTTYTVVITNNSGGTLQDLLFTDPAVPYLTVNNVTCAAANGATCPATSVAAMQGAGIPILSAELPDNSSLTFTIGATVSATAIPGSRLINTATVTTVGGSATSATDDDLVEVAPYAEKSFAPNAITENTASVLTITLTNPTASDVAGVSFTDTYPPGMVNTVNANAATTCGGTATAANNGNSLALSGGMILAGTSCTVTVNITGTPAGSYLNSTGIMTTDGPSISSVSALLTVNTAVFGAFNACDVAAVPNAGCTNATTVTNSRITTKVAGLPFNLDLVALKTDGTRNTNYSNTVMVELLDASNNSGALDAYNCRSTWTTVIATLAPNPAFANPNNGLISAGPFSVSEAYPNVRVRVTNVGGTFKKGCSTDSFAIRPNALVVSASDADWQTAGTARALVNTDAIGAVVHKAGQPFTVTATAVNALNATTVNYAGTPAFTLSACAGTACAASLGSFLPGAGSFVSGVLVSNTAAYSEVGAFNLTLQDADFASVDAGDTPATCGTGRYVCSAATPVGRFVPDHFDTAVVATATVPMPCPSGLACPVSYNGFVYSGQAFAAQAVARNAAEAVTLNYDSTTALSKAVTLTAWDTAGGAIANPAGGALAFNAVPAAAFSAGAATTSVPVYTFPTSPLAPTAIYIRATDADNVTSLRAASVEGGVMVVSGRVKISNAHGSELLSLPMRAAVQYYNTAGSWVVSTTDNATSFDTATDIVSNIVTGPLAGVSVQNAGAVTVVSGIMNFTLNRPLVAGSADISLGAPGYLLAGSNGAGVNPSKAGRATFGVYKGNNEFIYLRENY